MSENLPKKTRWDYFEKLMQRTVMIFSVGMKNIAWMWRTQSQIQAHVFLSDVVICWLNKAAQKVRLK